MPSPTLVAFFLIAAALCVPLEAKISVACLEGNPKLTAECEDDTVIKVTGHKWGEGTGECPPSEPRVYKDKTCMGNSAQYFEMCNGKKDCRRYLSPYMLEDHCRDTPIFVEVEYTCVNPNYEEVHVVRECDAKRVYLRCPQTTAIKIVDGNYGRLSMDVCNTGDAETWQNDDCRSDSSLKHIKSKCENKKVCSLFASLREFDNACRGTKKYLEVKYQCVPRS